MEWCGVGEGGGGYLKLLMLTCGRITCGNMKKYVSFY